VRLEPICCANTYVRIKFTAMRVVIQRVNKASVVVDKEVVGQINCGLLVLVGFEEEDNQDDVSWIVKKLSGLRIFDDSNGVMNLSIQDVEGDFLCVSQFTLHAKTKKGNRPSYVKAANPNSAMPLYHHFIKGLKAESGRRVEQGVFGAKMVVSLENDGPVTILIDTKNKE